MFEDEFDFPPPVPGALEFVLETDTMVAVFAAERLQRIDALREEFVADAGTSRYRFGDVVLRGLRLELAAAMRISEGEAGQLIALAEALVHRYPAALTALGGARITQKHATILADGLDELEPDLRDDLFPRALALAEVEPVGAFRRELRRMIDEARVVTLAERHEAALVQRRVLVESVGDGMAWTHHFGPEVEAHAVLGRVTAIAKTILAQPGETRTLDQIRADVFSDLLIEGTVTDHPAATRGIRATVVVTVPALALLLDDDAAVAAAGSDPARVEGIGPIPIGRARELCGGDASWMRVLTHPETGIVLSVGRDQYPPPAPLRRLVKWRADRCMGPGCGMPASRCEVDHTIAWEHGGTTALQNLAPLCRGHHKVKHHGGWKVQQVPDSGGAVQWTSPLGRQYVVTPERRVPVFRPTDDPPPF